MDIPQYKNVIGVATDMEKIRGGIKTGEKCITLLVNKKLGIEELDKKDRIPQEIDGIQTDVVEVGEITAPPKGEKIHIHGSNPRWEKHRPFKMGSSIGNIKITAGTAGGVVTCNGVKCVATNTHVACEDIRLDLSKQERRVCQPGIYDGGNESSDVFGETLKAVTMPEGQPAYNDWAIVKPYNEEELDAYIYGIGIPEGICSVSVGDKVWKSGRTTDVTHGEVLSLNASVLVGYGKNGRVTHHNCILCTDMSDGGDSGSWMLKEKKVWGYLFAGSDRVTVCHDIQGACQATGAKVFIPGQDDTGNRVKVEFRLVPVSDDLYDLSVYTFDAVSGEPVEKVLVLMDGAGDGYTGSDGLIVFNDVESGTYTLETRHDGYISQKKSVVLNRGRILLQDYS